MYCASQWSQSIISLGVLNAYNNVYGMKCTGRLRLRSKAAFKLLNSFSLIPKMVRWCVQTDQKDSTCFCDVRIIRFWIRLHVSYNCMILKSLTATVKSMLRDRNSRMEREVYGSDCDVVSSQKTLQLWGKYAATHIVSCRGIHIWYLRFGLSDFLQPPQNTDKIGTLPNVWNYNICAILTFYESWQQPSVQSRKRCCDFCRVLPAMIFFFNLYVIH